MFLLIFFKLYLLKGKDPRYSKYIIKGRKCKCALISMNNTRVIDLYGRFEKDKTSEKKNTILTEEATHFGDAVDKRIWTNYGHFINLNQAPFVSPRM